MQPLGPNFSAPDQRLWLIARARTKFQGHLLVYAVINGGLWLLWALLPESHGHHELPWPIWTSLFWGLGLVLQGLGAYGNFSQGERTQRAYERLLSQQNR